MNKGHAVAREGWYSRTCLFIASDDSGRLMEKHFGRNRNAVLTTAHFEAKDWGIVCR